MSNTLPFTTHKKMKRSKAQAKSRSNKHPAYSDFSSVAGVMKDAKAAGFNFILIDFSRVK